MRHNTFSGEVFVELAADALDVDGTKRSDAVVYRELLCSHVREVEFRGKEHRRIQYAVLTPFAFRGGLEPDLLNEVTYWIGYHSQYALFGDCRDPRAPRAPCPAPGMPTARSSHREMRSAVKGDKRGGDDQQRGQGDDPLGQPGESGQWDDEGVGEIAGERGDTSRC